MKLTKEERICINLDNIEIHASLLNKKETDILAVKHNILLLCERIRGQI